MKSRPISRVYHLLAGLALLALVAAAPPPLEPSSASWSRPVPLSPLGSMAWFPDVAADAAGRVHAVWSAGTAGYDQVMYAYTDDGQQWNGDNDIVARPQVGGSEATRPSLLVDAAGWLRLTFRDTDVYFEAARADQARGVSAWSAPFRVSGDQVAYFSRAAVDSRGRLHLVFTENAISNACNICYRLFYRHSDDNGLTWSAPVAISLPDTGSAKPQISIDGADNVHVVWEAGRGGSYGQLDGRTQVMYAASRDRGDTWSAPVALSGAASQGKNITLAARGDGTLLVVWLAVPADRPYYQVSQDAGRTWSSAQVLPGVWGGWTIYQSRLDDYASAVDGAGVVHLVLAGRTAEDQDTLDVLALAWDGQGWSPPESIVELNGDVPEWPRIAVNHGNQLHVVWFVRDEEHIWQSDAGQYRVWYARGLSSAPFVASVAWPAPAPVTPVVAATPAPATPTPAPPAEPNALPVQPGVGETIYTESDELVVIAKSLLPALVVTALAVVYARRLRR
jgi:hypothetical protein